MKGVLLTCLLLGCMIPGCMTAANLDEIHSQFVSDATFLGVPATILSQIKSIERVPLPPNQMVACLVSNGKVRLYVSSELPDDYVRDIIYYVLYSCLTIKET